MYFCTYAVLLMTLCVCVIPLSQERCWASIQKRAKSQKTQSHSKARHAPLHSQFSNISFSSCCTLVLWEWSTLSSLSYHQRACGQRGKFPVAPAVQCTMILACQYFIVYG